MERRQFLKLLGVELFSLSAATYTHSSESAKIAHATNKPQKRLVVIPGYRGSGAEWQETHQSVLSNYYSQIDAVDFPDNVMPEKDRYIDETLKVILKPQVLDDNVETHIIGSSMGGAIALMSADLYPQVLKDAGVSKIFYNASRNLYNYDPSQLPSNVRELEKVYCRLTDPTLAKSAATPVISYGYYDSQVPRINGQQLAARFDTPGVLFMAEHTDMISNSQIVKKILSS